MTGLLGVYVTGARAAIVAAAMAQEAIKAGGGTLGDDPLGDGSTRQDFGTLGDGFTASMSL